MLAVAVVIVTAAAVLGEHEPAVFSLVSTHDGSDDRRRTVDEVRMLRDIAFHKAPVKSFDVARPHGTLWSASRMKLREEKEVPPIFDGTPFMRKLLQKDVPKGAIALEQIPIFGKQGMGKSELVATLAEWVVEKHGEENVQCLISNDFRALIANIDPTKRVYVLFLDDALDKALSRGGTNKDMVQTIAELTKVRHRIEEAKRVLYGEEVTRAGGTMDNMHHEAIVYFLIATQSFKGTEKLFRQGVTIFKGPMEEDRLEIDQYWRGSIMDGGFASRTIEAAWKLLFRVQRKRMEDGDYQALSDSIVVLPSRGPMKLHAPMVWICAACGHKSTPQPDKAPGCLACGKKDRRQRTERVDFESRSEQETHLAQTEQNNHVAELFLVAHNPNEGAAQALLRDFLRQYVIKLGNGEVADSVVRVSDISDLLEPARVRQILDRGKALQLEKAKATASGIAGGNDDDAVIDKVSGEYLAAGRDPLAKGANATLYTFIRKYQGSFRERAEALLDKILKVAKTTRIDQLAAELHEEVSPETHVAMPSAPREPGAQFVFDIQAAVEALPERKAQDAVRDGKSSVEERRQWKKWCKAWRMNRDPSGNGYSRGDLAARSLELFGEKVSERSVGNWAASVEQALGNVMGVAYEAWWEQQLRAGWRHAGLRAARIRSVQRGGGTGHEPDIIVTYVDGHVDYWSLKAYTTKDPCTLRLRHLPQRPSDFLPELQAFHRAWDARESSRILGLLDDHATPVPRLCIVFREVATDGAEYYRAYERPEQMNSNVSFSRGELSGPTALVWERRAEPLDAPAADGAGAPA